MKRSTSFPLNLSSLVDNNTTVCSPAFFKITKDSYADIELLAGTHTHAHTDKQKGLFVDPLG